MLFRPGPRRAGAALLLVLASLLWLLAIPPVGAAVPARSAGSSPGFLIPGTWTTYHGAENRSGYSPVAGPGQVGLAWSSCISSYHLRVTPVTDGSRIFIADDLGTIYALNASSNGSVLWRVDFGGTPVELDLAGNALLVAASSGVLSALNPLTGAYEWRITLPSPPVQGIAVSGGDLYVATRTGELDAFTVAQGTELWRLALDGPASGAPSVDSGIIYTLTTVGSLYAVASDGAPLWRSDVGQGAATAPAISDGRVVVGTVNGSLRSFGAVNGSLLWSWPTGPEPNDSIHATPAVGGGRVVAQMDSGSVVELNESTGAFRWETPGEFSPYPSTAAPVLTPNGIYSVVNGVQSVWDLDPATGRLLWQFDPSTFLFSSPSLSNGDLLVGTDAGCLLAFGRPGGAFPWPVTGTVETAGHQPIAGAQVVVGSALATTSSNGSFALDEPNGSYPVLVYATSYAPYVGSLLVDGAVPPLTIVLPTLALYPVRGTVVDGGSGTPMAGVEVVVQGPYAYANSTTTDAEGRFTLEAPNGTENLSTAIPTGFSTATATVVVAGGPVSGVFLAPIPTTTSLSTLDPDHLEVLLPLAALGAAAAVLAVAELGRRRVAGGLTPALLSPFGRFVAMRLLLIPVQLLTLLAVLFFVGDLVRDLGLGLSPCSLSVSACGCSWGNLPCVTQAYLQSFGSFLQSLFSGNWGYVAYGHLREPVATLLGWWLPNSIELALVSLSLSLATAYPLALVAGWRSHGPVDPSVRLASLVGMMVPTFVVGLIVLALIGSQFLGSIGDSTVGILPTDTWFLTHGGYPGWVAVGSNTTPTGLPLVDGALHGDWSFERVVAAKTLLQAAIISVVYIAVFLRHARSAVVDAARELHIQAARSRGVPERTLLWTHTRRRVLPVYALTFGLTLPAFLGTQAVVEALFNDPGFGTLLLYEITNIRGNPLGFSGGLNDGFYQVALLFLILIVLFSALGADLLARYLDPRTRGAA